MGEGGWAMIKPKSLVTVSLASSFCSGQTCMHGINMLRKGKVSQKPLLAFISLTYI